jgi:hypothetical protein
MPEITSRAASETLTGSFPTMILFFIGMICIAKNYCPSRQMISTHPDSI